MSVPFAAGPAPTRLPIHRKAVGFGSLGVHMISAGRRSGCRKGRKILSGQVLSP